MLHAENHAANGVVVVENFKRANLFESQRFNRPLLHLQTADSAFYKRDLDFFVAELVRLVAFGVLDLVKMSFGFLHKVNVNKSRCGRLLSIFSY